ncbi:hypothetical protein BDY21DRAFT_290150 [Lineolata rhizophorae]|uniref:C2H2-type domain-containing protein n=1 Tax=Lineolata rhizophorae TaxID=578093 RepID=A0A6A6NTL0_9PEZI|nr:hypothetical protein BDY21DRAFT_290150 [Lineolata rhizophorae]
MQTSKSSVDFANLLNPGPPQPSHHRLHPPTASSSSSPSSPLPGRDPAATASMAAPAVSLMAPMMQNAQPAQEEHRQDLPRPYKCPLCDKAFHRLEHQTRHIRTHTGEKPHACQFPGCTKRFSRSDELTRHSRIHSNPSSRRGNKHAAAQAAAQAAANAGLAEHGNPMMMPPPPKTISRSAPSSNINSPDVSPPGSFSNFSGLPSYNRATSSHGSSPNSLQRPMAEMGVGILATAASQVEKQHRMPPPHHSHSSRHGHGNHLHTYSHHAGSSSSRLPSLSQYAYSSQPMSRSHSHEDDDPYSHRMTKKSRPGSPMSTAPPSPSFSHDSCSPTPDHTPLATPAHSPRLRPHGFHDVQLPHIRQLSLHPAPALAPMEPNSEAAQPYVPSERSGLSISDIISRSEGSQRKLPVPSVPKVAVQDLLNNNSNNGGFSSSNSSTANSIAGNDLQERY